MKSFFSWIGAQGVPHIESSDSEHSYRDSDSENSESDEDVEEEINIDVEREYPKVPPPKVLILPSGAKKWIPSCDKIYKPRTSQHFPTLEDAFLFYREYGRHFVSLVRNPTEGVMLFPKSCSVIVVAILLRAN